MDKLYTLCIALSVLHASRAFPLAAVDNSDLNYSGEEGTDSPLLFTETPMEPGDFLNQTPDATASTTTEDPVKRREEALRRYIEVLTRVLKIMVGEIDGDGESGSGDGPNFDWSTYLTETYEDSLPDPDYDPNEYLLYEETSDAPALSHPPQQSPPSATDSPEL
nr:Ov3.5 [Ovine gammaherpesvirus 2]